MTDRWVEIGPDVFVRRYDELDLCIGLVIGDGACLVVDTRGDGVQGAELAAAVRARTDAPWTLVYTHGHFDHCFGTSAFGAADIWAHPLCRPYLDSSFTAQRDEWVRTYREKGQPDLAEALAAAELVLPNRFVSDAVRLDIGGRPVELRHPGRGHTDHDLIVYVPDAGVVFAGDLVEQGAPPLFGESFPDEWPVALDRILAYRPRVVVPGHGEPVDAEFVAAQRVELATIAALCAEAVAGRPVAAERSPYPADTLKAAIESARALAAGE